MGVCLDSQLISGFVAAFPHGYCAHFSKLLLQCPYSLHSPFQHFHIQCDLSELRMCLWSWKIVGKAVDLGLKEAELCSVDWQCKTCCIILWGRSFICWNIRTLTEHCLSSASEGKATNEWCVVHWGFLLFLCGFFFFFSTSPCCICLRLHTSCLLPTYLFLPWLLSDTCQQLLTWRSC